MYFNTSYTFVHCTDQQPPTQSCCRNAPLFFLSHWFSWPLCLAASGGKKHAHVLCELICWERQRGCAAGESSRTACRIPILNMHSRGLFCMLHISNRFIWFHWGFIYNVFIFPRLWPSALHCSSKSFSLASIALDLQRNLIPHNQMQLGMCPTEGSDA